MTDHCHDTRERLKEELSAGFLSSEVEGHLPSLVSPYIMTNLSIPPPSLPFPLTLTWTIFDITGDGDLIMPHSHKMKKGAFSTTLIGVESPYEVYSTKRYKPVANRVKLVKTMLPEEYRIVRHNHPNPLQGMLILLSRLPDFVPSRLYMTK